MTDYVVGWVPTFCDECGAYWLADLMDDAVEVSDLLACSPREIGLTIGRRRMVPWSEAVALVVELYDLELLAADGQPIDEETARNIKREVSVSVRREMSAGKVAP